MDKMDINQMMFQNYYRHEINKFVAKNRTQQLIYCVQKCHALQQSNNPQVELPLRMCLRRCSEAITFQVVGQPAPQ